MYGLRGRIRLNGTGAIDRLVGIRSEIALRGSNTATVSSNIKELQGIYIGYNSLGNARYTGTIDKAYDIYVEAANYDGLKNRIKESYGLFVNGVHKVNYFSGSLGIGTTSPTEKLEVAGNIKTSSLAQTGAGDRPVVADANGVLKIGTASTVATKVGTGKADLQCNDANRGAMNFVKDVAMLNGSTADVFAVCLKGSNGTHYWRYLYGAGGNSTGTGVFGSGL